jgi:hypothetical protein
VTVYLLKLSSGDEAGLLPVLADDQQDALLTQWRSYRADIERTDSPPSEIEHTMGPVAAEPDGRVDVNAELFPVWWNYGSAGTSLSGTRHPWRFTVVEEGGWRIRAVLPHPWCGGNVRADACR